MKSVLLCAALLSVFFSSPARAEGDIAILGGVGFNTASITGNNDSTMARGGFSGGFAYTHWLQLPFGVEADVIYALRKYNFYPNGVGPVREQHSFFEFPVFARWLALSGVSVGLGPYLAENTSGDFPNRTEFGFAGSLRFQSPAYSGFSVLVDVRYLLGLTNQTDVPGETFRSRQMEVLGGFAYVF